MHKQDYYPITFLKHIFQKHTALTVLFLFLVIGGVYFMIKRSQAQIPPPEWQWVQQFSGPSDVQGKVVALDEAGNVYTAGVFVDEMNFVAPGSCDTLSGPGGSLPAIFVAKFNSEGVCVWATSIAGGGISLDVSDIAVHTPTGDDPEIYISGQFQGSIDFGNFTVDASDDFGLSDDLPFAFVARLKVCESDLCPISPSFEWQWVSTVTGDAFFGQGGNALALDLAFDDPEMDDPPTSVYFIGHVNSDAFVILNVKNKSGSITGFGVTYDTADLDVFVAKIDTTFGFFGDLMNMISFAGGAGYDIGLGITEMNGQVFISGEFEGHSATFAPGEPEETEISGLNTFFGFNAFVAKYDDNLNFIWARPLGGDGLFNRATDIEFDPVFGPAVFVTGIFSGNATEDISYEEITTTSIVVGNSPHGVGVNSVTNKIYVTNSNDNTISVIDGSSDTVIETIPVGGQPLGVGVNSVTNKIYVSNFNDNTVSVIDGSSDTVIETIPVGGQPFEVDVNSVTNKIYVTNSSDNTVSVIDGSSDTVIETIPVGNLPRGVGVNSVTNKIYVTNSSDNTVSVIDGSSDTVIETIPVGNSPHGVGVNSVTNKIYVTNSNDNTISVIDGSSDTVIETIPVGSFPFEVDVNSVTNKIYVTNSDDNTVSVIDGSSDTVIDTISVGNLPIGVGVNSVTNNIYVVNIDENIISVIKVNAVSFSNLGFEAQSTNGRDIFVSRLNANTGEIIWAQQVANNASENPSLDLSVENPGVYVAGDWKDQAVFYNDGDIADSIFDSGNEGDVFVAGYSSAGAFEWFQTAGGDFFDHINDVVAGGLWYVVGSYASNPVVFGSNELPHDNPGVNFNGFLARLGFILEPISPPTVTKFFEPSRISQGGSTFLAFTFDNSVNTSPVSFSFEDDLPDGLSWDTDYFFDPTAGGGPTGVNNLGDSCFIGSVDLVGEVIIVDNFTVAAGATCRLRLRIKHNENFPVGDYENLTSIINYTGGESLDPLFAVLSIQPPLSNFDISPAEATIFSSPPGNTAELSVFGDPENGIELFATSLQNTYNPTTSIFSSNVLYGDEPEADQGLRLRINLLNTKTPGFIFGPDDETNYTPAELPKIFFDDDAETIALKLESALKPMFKDKIAFSAEVIDSNMLDDHKTILIKIYGAVGYFEKGDIVFGSLNWESSDETIVSVAPTNQVTTIATGFSLGEATITLNRVNPLVQINVYNDFGQQFSMLQSISLNHFTDSAEISVVPRPADTAPSSLPVSSGGSIARCGSAAREYSAYEQNFSGDFCVPSFLTPMSIPPFPSSGAVASWHCGAVSCFASKQVMTATPSVDLKANGEDGPITLNESGEVVLSWTSANVSSCGTSFWPLLEVPLDLPQFGIFVGQSMTFAISCTAPGGHIVSDKVVIRVSRVVPPELSGVTPIAEEISPPSLLDITDFAGEISFSPPVLEGVSPDEIGSASLFQLIFNFGQKFSRVLRGLWFDFLGWFNL